jgi:hypothetical protein
MKGMLLVTGAVLFQFHTLGSRALVFGGDIVTLTTLGARQRDVYSHLLPPPSHFKPSLLIEREQNSTGKPLLFPDHL